MRLIKKSSNNFTISFVPLGNKNEDDKAKEFAKQNIKYNGKKYDASNEFIEEYYGGNRINNLVNNIKAYTKLKKKHEKDELYLANLLK